MKEDRDSKRAQNRVFPKEMRIRDEKKNKQKNEADRKMINFFGFQNDKMGDEKRGIKMMSEKKNCDQKN